MKNIHRKEKIYFLLTVNNLDRCFLVRIFLEIDAAVVQVSKPDGNSIISCVTSGNLGIEFKTSQSLTNEDSRFLPFECEPLGTNCRRTLLTQLTDHFLILEFLVRFTNSRIQTHHNLFTKVFIFLWKLWKDSGFKSCENSANCHQADTKDLSSSSKDYSWEVYRVLANQTLGSTVSL